MPIDNDTLYDRQETLDADAPETATVIGVGGVGSWIAFDLALAGVETIYLVDHDHIEGHNLNRTPFKTSQVDNDKTTALATLIAERRPETEVIPVNDRIEDVGNGLQSDMADSVVVDCRDHASRLPEDIEDSVVLTAGYDGFEFTFHVNPDYGNIWGDEETEYETVPSFVAPPQFLASMATTVVCTDAASSESEAVTGNLKELLCNLDRLSEDAETRISDSDAEKSEGDSDDG